MGKSTGDSSELLVLDQLPKEFFQLGPKELHQLFPGPTLIRLRSSQRRWVFVSTLLHGNETTGLRGLQQLLLEYDSDLPCSLLLLLGNPAAAAQGLRSLPGQVDQNRIWADEALQSTPWAQALLKEVLAHQPMTAIDIHNTTGRGDPYSAIDHLTAEHMFLAKEFSPNVVHFREPHTTLINALGGHMPAVVLECGPSQGDESRREHLVNYLKSVLSWPAVGQTQLVDPGHNLFESHARVFVSGEFSFGSGGERGLNLDGDLDLNNFKLLPIGQLWGTYQSLAEFEFSVRDLSGKDITADYFAIAEGQIRVTQSFIPSLITTSVPAVQEDCLCYIMKRIGES